MLYPMLLGLLLLTEGLPLLLAVRKPPRLLGRRAARWPHHPPRWRHARGLRRATRSTCRPIRCRPASTATSSGAARPARKRTPRVRCSCAYRRPVATHIALVCS